MVRLFIASLVFSALTPLTCHAADPLAGFEALIKNGVSNTQKVRVYFAPKISKWVRQHVTVTEVRFDVRKTDSLVSPVIGDVSFTVTTKNDPRFDTEAEANAAGEVIEGAYRRVDNVKLTYGYRSDAWAFLAGERAYNLDGVAPLKAALTEKDLAGDLQGWRP